MGKKPKKIILILFSIIINVKMLLSLLIRRSRIF